MTRVLLTGVSGVGKSTVLGELAELGYRTIDTDYGGWCVSRWQRVARGTGSAGLDLG